MTDLPEEAQKPPPDLPTEWSSLEETQDRLLLLLSSYVSQNRPLMAEDMGSLLSILLLKPSFTQVTRFLIYPHPPSDHQWGFSLVFRYGSQTIFFPDQLMLWSSKDHFEIHGYYFFQGEWRDKRHGTMRYTRGTPVPANDARKVTTCDPDKVASRLPLV